MRARALAVALSMTVPAVGASAQTSGPAVYVCTPDAVVHKIVGNSSTRLFNGTGTFNDCDLGKDGHLYIANDLKILRINPANKNTAKNDQAFIGTLPYAISGLAFNGPVLYANTLGGVYKLVGNDADPMSFSPPSLVEAGDPLQAGGGLVFDVIGNLVFARNGDVRRLQPSPNPESVAHYSGGTQTVLAGANAYGLAAAPCRYIFYGDTVAKSIKRIPAGGGTPQTVASLGVEFPAHIAADAAGSLYVVAAANPNGQNANVYRYDFNGGVLDCSSTPSRTTILSVSKAVGIAVAPREVSLTQVFEPTACEKKVDFGFHSVMITLGTCAASAPKFTLQITARQSEPSDVTYAGQLDPTTTTHFNYSANRGFATEMLLHAVPCSTQPCPAGETDLVSQRGGYTARYWFFTQDIIYVPALGRSAEENLTAPYNERHPLQNFWDLGFDPGGEDVRRGDFSKYLMVNQNVPGLCEAPPENFESPLTGLLTPAQAGSSLKIAFIAEGENCGGKTLRLSVAKISNDPTAGCNPLNVGDIETIPVESPGGAQTDNIMSNVGDRYSFQLKTNTGGVGTFRFTISGEGLKSVGGCYVVSQAQ